MEKHGGYTPWGRLVGILLILVSLIAIAFTCAYTIARVML